MFLKKSNDDDGGALHPRAAAMGACATKCFASDPPLRSSYPPTRSAEDEYRVALLVLPLVEDVKTRVVASRLSRGWRDADKSAASLPAKLDGLDLYPITWTDRRSKRVVTVSYEYVMRHEGVLDLPKERVEALLTRFWEPPPLRYGPDRWFKDTYYFCARAAFIGNLELLQWLREHDYPWDAGTCANAVFGSHLEVLGWALANGAPWDNIETASFPVSCGVVHRVNVRTWLLTNRKKDPRPSDWEKYLELLREADKRQVSKRLVARR